MTLFENLNLLTENPILLAIPAIGSAVIPRMAMAMSNSAAAISRLSGVGRTVAPAAINAVRSVSIEGIPKITAGMQKSIHRLPQTADNVERETTNAGKFIRDFKDEVKKQMNDRGESPSVEYDDMNIIIKNDY